MRTSIQLIPGAEHRADSCSCTTPSSVNYMREYVGGDVVIDAYHIAEPAGVRRSANRHWSTQPCEAELRWNIVHNNDVIDIDEYTAACSESLYRPLEVHSQKGRTWKRRELWSTDLADVTFRSKTLEQLHDVNFHAQRRPMRENVAVSGNRVRGGEYMEHMQPRCNADRVPTIIWCPEDSLLDKHFLFEPHQRSCPKR